MSELEKTQADVLEEWDAKAFRCWPTRSRSPSVRLSPLSPLGEAGAGEFAADSPATERDRVAEAALREGQAGGWESGPLLRPERCSCVLSLCANRRKISRREMWQLGEEAGTDQTVSRANKHMSPFWKAKALQRHCLKNWKRQKKEYKIHQKLNI